MHPSEAWFVLVSVTFLIAILGMMVAFVVLGSILRQVCPLLTETRQHIQDLGDVTVETVGHAADTMDLIECRVSDTMEQVEFTGTATGRLAQSYGPALAGGFLAVYLIKLVRKGREQ